MMKKILVALFLSALMTCAHAQGLVAPGHVIGNGTATNPHAATDSSLSSVMDQAIGSASNSIPERKASSWGSLALGAGVDAALAIAPNTTGGFITWPLNLAGAGVSGQLPLSGIATIAADNVIGNFTASSAAPQSGALVNCSNALTYSTTTHTFGCNSSTGTGTVTQVTPGAGISTTPAAGGSTPITASGTIYLDASYEPNFIGGLILSNDSTSPNTVVDIAAGAANDSTNTYRIKIGAITKSIAGAWVSGSGQNGMGNGLTAAASTWYHVCLAYNGGTPDIWFDTSATCANKPTGISGSFYRRIGSFKTDASIHIIAFSQNGDEFLWSAPTQDVATVTTTTTTTNLYTLNVPPGVKVSAEISGLLNTTASTLIWLASPDQAAAAGNNTTNFSLGVFGAAYSTGVLIVRTNTSQQIRGVASTTSANITIATQGWIDARGK